MSVVLVVWVGVRLALSERSMRWVSVRCQGVCDVCGVTGSKRKKEDTFGINDDDWDVYKQIVSVASASI